MVKHIMGYKMSEATGGSEKIFAHAYQGATTDHMNSHCIPTMKRTQIELIIIIIIIIIIINNNFNYLRTVAHSAS